MPDHAENLQTVLRTLCGDDWHVGEVIPQTIARPTVYVRQSGEILDDSLDADPEELTFDIELASRDIAALRTKSAAVKSGLRALKDWPADLPGVQFVSVDAHDVDYIPELAFDDDDLQLETMAVSLHL